MYLPTNFLTYFWRRRDVSSERPPILTSNNDADDPPPRNPYAYLGRRLIAPTVPSLNEADARANNALGPNRLRSSTFSALLLRAGTYTAKDIYDAVRLRTGESTLVGGETINPLVYKHWTSGNGQRILFLFAWLADAVFEFNAIDFLAGTPATAYDLVDRAIQRLCRDGGFQREYNACRHTRAAQSLYTGREDWAFNPDVQDIARHGFISIIKKELTHLADDVNTRLILKLREKARNLIATSAVFGPRGTSMSRSFELPKRTGVEALAILTAIGRNVSVDERKNEILTLCLNGQGVQNLYKSDALRELTNTLISALGLLNVARGLTFAAHGVTFAAHAQGQPGTQNSLPAVREAALPVACMTIAASLLECELRTLSELEAHFGIRMAPVVTMEYFTREERSIIATHRHIFILITQHTQRDASYPATSEVKGLYDIAEGVRSGLDRSLDIAGINALLESQSVIQNLPIWAGD